jgi:alpha-amylase
MSQRGIVLYLHVHQPFRVRPYSVFDTGVQHDYFSTRDNGALWDNQATFLQVAEKSYRPMNALLLKLLATHPDFRFSLSISGTFIEQAKLWAPDVLDSFKQLVTTGRVEILAETYHHSLAYFYSRDEFERQVWDHQALIKETFGVTSRVLRNTELAYNDSLAAWAKETGFTGIVAEGWDPVLDWRSPNYVYTAADTSLPLLLKNYRLSDDIAFRFSDRSWNGWPLTSQKYHNWIDASLGDQDVMNLFMDYETFGEHQWNETGIFDFFADFITSWSSNQDGTFYTVSEAIGAHAPKGEISMPRTVTWADESRDLSAWMGNKLQQEALRYVYSLEADIIRSNDDELIRDWRRLQTSDHFYYMCTKGFADGTVHAYFSPYESPYEAFLYYLNAIRDLRWRLHVHHQTGVLHG